MKIALVGLPGSGKSQVFSALSGQAPDSNLEYGKSVARIVEVYDARLEVLRDIYQPKKFTPATIEVEDFPGIDSSQVKANASFFASLREADALCCVLRGFLDPSFAHDPADVDPLRDWQRLLGDLQIADLEMIEKRIDRLEKQVRRPTKTQKDDQAELDLLVRCQTILEEGGRLADVTLKAGEEELLRSFRFLTQKPIMIILNLDEDADDGAEFIATLSDQVENVVALKGRLEAEIAQLDPEEAELFMTDFEITETASRRVIQALYELLGLCAFLTSGEDEVRAWTIRRGDNAVTAASKIHSDIARGFIRAEVVAFTDFEAAGGMREAKAANTVRLEGKEYEVADGDIINFRFSV